MIRFLGMYPQQQIHAIECNFNVENEVQME
jgi:hypothetical protein